MKRLTFYVKAMAINFALLSFSFGASAQTSIQWQKCLGGTSDDGAHFIQQTLDGGYIVAGWTFSNDGDVSGNHDSADYWVVKLIFSPTNIAEDINSPSYIKIYPNPFTDFINIDIGDKTADVKLMNLLGQVVFSESLRQNKNVVSGINIPAGVYILQVQNSKIFSTQMVVKK